ncbi:MAG: hypothetical protein Faunusvirus30_2 [Faunusvirus sp.]|jgi:hypothetical protein|uniref:Uncharacterized protein n=1 Tax=Faunusvirus sp. TaxID=2487766 RepID=A0A3G5A185_9VIRU|nr:MAG: hypothetical protein Faunusvirus30_2 [Faunusvirus sp.]
MNLTLKTIKEITKFDIQKKMSLNDYASSYEYSIFTHHVNIDKMTTTQNGYTYLIRNLDGIAIYALYKAKLVFDNVDFTLDELSEITNITIEINGCTLYSLSGIELIALCIMNKELITIVMDKIYISIADLCFSQNTPLFINAAAYAQTYIHINGDYKNGVTFEYIPAFYPIYDYIPQDCPIYDVSEAQINKYRMIDKLLQKDCYRAAKTPKNNVIRQIVSLTSNTAKSHCNINYFSKFINCTIFYSNDFGNIIDTITPVVSSTHKLTLDVEIETIRDSSLWNDPVYITDVKKTLHDYLFMDVVGIISKYIVQERYIYLCRYDELSPFDTTKLGDPLNANRCDLSVDIKLRDNAEYPATIMSTSITTNILMQQDGMVVMRYST